MHFMFVCYAHDVGMRVTYNVKQISFNQIGTS
jgi:hypothetical protein